MTSTVIKKTTICPATATGSDAAPATTSVAESKTIIAVTTIAETLTTLKPCSKLTTSTFHAPTNAPPAAATITIEDRTTGYVATGAVETATKNLQPVTALSRVQASSTGSGSQTVPVETGLSSEGGVPAQSGAPVDSAVPINGGFSGQNTVPAQSGVKHISSLVTVASGSSAAATSVPAAPVYNTPYVSTNGTIPSAVSVVPTGIATPPAVAGAGMVTVGGWMMAPLAIALFI